jgi:hypothetical protein
VRLRAAGVVLVALLATACAPSPPLPDRPVAAGPDVALTIAAAPLDPTDAERQTIGAFSFAGGLVIASGETSRLHGLSDMAISPEGALLAVTDDGDFFEARLRLDDAGRLAGLERGRISPMRGPDERPLQDKADADAEGLALLANGDRLVSFERRHRIWLYPADGTAPRPVPAPQESFPDNGGMEALAPDPAAGPDAYVVGAEEAGQTWTCRIVVACTAGPRIEKPPEFGLVALTRLKAGRTAYLLRAWDPARGNRIVLTIQGADGEVGRLELARPLTVDNYEGLAALPRPDGAVRFYLLSDDNFSPSQRTLLLAFDWRP